MRIAAFFRCRPGLLPGVLFALVCVGVFRDAGAQTAPAWNENRMTVDPPTTCTNGRPVSECPVTGYIVEHARSQAGPFTQIATPAAFPYTHIAQAGENCYRFRAQSANGPSAPSAALLCRTNVEPAPVPSPPSNPRFVTIGAVNHSLINATPVVSILSGNRPGSVFGLVPIGRTTQGPPIFTYRKQSYCRVEVGTRELWGTTDPNNLAAPCAPRA